MSWSVYVLTAVTQPWRWCGWFALEQMQKSSRIVRTIRLNVKLIVVKCCGGESAKEIDLLRTD